MSDELTTLEGRLIGVAGKADVANVEVWFAYQTVAGEKVTATTRSDANGQFTFVLPDAELEQARVGAGLVGASPVDLEPAGQRLEPGDVVLTIDDLLPSHLRYGGG